eukprot:NODE_291_length_2517_cov_5.846029_g268_i0.p1 GENE.NODE_291_length_2517_cov_5.846029_g268_i0~~NODE_291_length_2517_cov_5.846029_g268_i0.p1  ORF type:complete len:466 (+),score=-75.47 NODE_291_length_2517_cov_5.846029_g268_i0:515-1912(+)
MDVPQFDKYSEKNISDLTTNFINVDKKIHQKMYYTMERNIDKVSEIFTEVRQKLNQSGNSLNLPSKRVIHNCVRNKHQQRIESNKLNFKEKIVGDAIIEHDDRQCFANVIINEIPMKFVVGTKYGAVSSNRKKETTFHRIHNDYIVHNSHYGVAYTIDDFFRTSKYYNFPRIYDEEFYSYFRLSPSLKIKVMSDDIIMNDYKDEYIRFKSFHKGDENHIRHAFTIFMAKHSQFQLSKEEAMFLNQYKSRALVKYAFNAYMTHDDYHPEYCIDNLIRQIRSKYDSHAWYTKMVIGKSFPSDHFVYKLPHAEQFVLLKACYEEQSFFNLFHSCEPNFSYISVPCTYRDSDTGKDMISYHKDYNYSLFSMSNRINLFGSILTLPLISKKPLIDQIHRFSFLGKKRIETVKDAIFFNELAAEYMYNNEKYFMVYKINLKGNVQKVPKSCSDGRYFRHNDNFERTMQIVK